MNRQVMNFQPIGPQEDYNYVVVQSSDGGILAACPWSRDERIPLGVSLQDSLLYLVCPIEVVEGVKDKIQTCKNWVSIFENCEE